MPEEAPVEVKVEAWRLATQQGMRQTAIAERLGISQSAVSRYIRDGRACETFSFAFDLKEMKDDHGATLKYLIRRWMRRLEECEDPKLEAVYGELLRKHLVDFADIFGLKAPVRHSVGRDDEEVGALDERMLVAIRSAQRDNVEYHRRIEAGLPGWPNDEEESA